MRIKISIARFCASGTADCRFKPRLLKNFRTFATPSLPSATSVRFSSNTTPITRFTRDTVQHVEPACMLFPLTRPSIPLIERTGRAQAVRAAIALINIDPNAGIYPNHHPVPSTRAQHTVTVNDNVTRAFRHPLARAENLVRPFAVPTGGFVTAQRDFFVVVMNRRRMCNNESARRCRVAIPNCCLTHRCCLRLQRLTVCGGTWG